MLILLTNDDGIRSQGLYQLVCEVRKVSHVAVVAPEREQSATGHAITIHRPLRVNRADLFDGVPAWMVDGTPADCVKIGINALLSEQPDLVISGINRGPNLGVDVLYSGTVSAAVEGCIHGIPSVAASVSGERDVDFGPAARFCRGLSEEVLKHGLPERVLLNVNVPCVSQPEISGVKVTRLGSREWNDGFIKRKDPAGREYYWLSAKPTNSYEEGTDVSAIRENAISVTPLHINLTAHDTMEFLKEFKLHKP